MMAGLQHLRPGCFINFLSNIWNIMGANLGLNSLTTRMVLYPILKIKGNQQPPIKSVGGQTLALALEHGQRRTTGIEWAFFSGHRR